MTTSSKLFERDTTMIELDRTGWENLYETCEDCNYDRHVCCGCGDPVPHPWKACGGCSGRLCSPHEWYLISLEPDTEGCKYCLETRPSPRAGHVVVTSV